MYALTRITMRNPPKIKIDANRYSALKNAMGIHIAALHVETIFDLLIRNYKEFEHAAAPAAADPNPTTRS